MKSTMSKESTGKLKEREESTMTKAIRVIITEDFRSELVRSSREGKAIKVYSAKGEGVKLPKVKTLKKYIDEVMNDLQYMQGLERIAVRKWIATGSTDGRKKNIGSSSEYIGYRPFTVEDKQDIYYNSLEATFVESVEKTVYKMHHLLGGNPKKEDFRRMFASFVKSSIRYQTGVFVSKANGIPFYGEIKDGIKQEKQINNLEAYSVAVMLREVDRTQAVEKHLQNLVAQGLQGKKKAIQVYNVYTLLLKGYDKSEIATTCSISRMQVHRVITEIGRIIQ